MGCDFDFFTYKDCSTTELKKQYKTYCKNAAYENGHSYSGSLNMTSGLEYHIDKTFDTFDDAYNYVTETAKKWGNAVAVPYMHEGNLEWFVGGKCSS